MEALAARDPALKEILEHLGELSCLQSQVVSAKSCFELDSMRSFWGKGRGWRGVSGRDWDMWGFIGCKGMRIW